MQTTEKCALAVGDDESAVGSVNKQSSADGSPVVPVITFHGDQRAESAEVDQEHKAIILEALANHSKWHGQVHDLVANPKNRIKVTCTLSKDGTLIAAHLVSHSDFKLIELGRKYAFPRGCCFIAHVGARRLVGHGTFYPKFSNDDRNAGFSAQDFGNVSRISCFIKYSGSTGIVTIIRDLDGTVVGWTGSSKNSCNHATRDDGSSSYPSETVSAFAKYVNADFLSWCQRCSITSIGLEVMIERDQTHGYGYTKSGCIVTAICAESVTDGCPNYLSPQEVYESCRQVGLPTDRPIIVEGKSSIQNFVESISDIRDVLTLSALRHVLQKQGTELETVHEQIIDSQIIEGFVIRRWRDDKEIESVKFKIWLYQMVTQVLRPSLSGKFSASSAVPSLKDSDGTLRQEFLGLVQSQMKKWCVVPESSTQVLCYWVVCTAGKACLPTNHPQLQWAGGVADFPVGASVPYDCVARDPVRAYWITLGDYAVKRLIAHLDGSDWDVRRAAQELHSTEWLELDEITHEQEDLPRADNSKGKGRKGDKKRHGKHGGY